MHPRKCPTSGNQIFRLRSTTRLPPYGRLNDKKKAPLDDKKEKEITLWCIN